MMKLRSKVVKSLNLFVPLMYQNIMQWENIVEEIFFVVPGWQQVQCSLSLSNFLLLPPLIRLIFPPRS